MTDSLVALALEDIDRTKFERLSQFALETVYGWQFAPTGGIHDGGLDGYFRKDDEHHFFQASKQQDASAKIRKTIRDIRKKRTLKKVTYATSVDVKDQDVLEATIQKDTGVEIHILPRSWFLLQCDLRDEIKNFLFKHSTELIESIQLAVETSNVDTQEDNISILTYMEMESASLKASADFNVLCVDTVIYQSLEGTDPEQDKFRTADEISTFVNSKYPNLIGRSKQDVRTRLGILSSKSNSPRIRKHPIDQYGLPYDVRNAFSDRNTSIRAARDKFVSSVLDRLSTDHSDLPQDVRASLLTVITETVIETYRQQAINFIVSFEKMDEDYRIPVFDIINKNVDKLALPKEDADLYKDISSITVRHIFYSSTDVEREYIFLLMKFFSLHFIMQGDTAVENYFSSMAKRLKLFVGADIIVRVLSESLVKKSSRAMTNTLGLLQTCGVSLFVTRQIMQEVYHHIKGSNSEFIFGHQECFRHISLEEAKNFDKILIRSFYYAYLEPDKHEKSPSNWTNYLSNFGSASWFEKDTNCEDDFGTFLAHQYGLTFIESDTIRADVDPDEVQELANKIMEIRGSNSTDVAHLLARNDAEMTIYVEKQRIKNNERVATDTYGMNTWWLSEEVIVLRAAKQIGRQNDTIMNPQFLMNHYFLDPTTIQNQQNMEVAMPTTFGLRITDRISRNRMDKFIEEVSDLADLDEAVIKSRIRAASNKLKKSTT